MSQYETNANGDTYGSVFDARGPEVEPDLIAVLADNGNSGYAYKVDLDPDYLQPSSPAEAVAMQGARDQKQIDAFVASLSAQLGRPIELDNDAEAALREVVVGPVTSDSHGNSPANARLADALGVTASPSGDGGEEMSLGAVAAAVKAAREALCREIPVYLSDGRTRVGVFTAGC